MEEVDEGEGPAGGLLLEEVLGVGDPVVTGGELVARGVLDRVDPGLDLDLAAEGRKGSPDDRKSAPVAEKVEALEAGYAAPVVGPFQFTTPAPT